MDPLKGTEIAALREQAEDAVIWQDEWNNPSGDGSAVGQWLDTASPELVLRLLSTFDALAAGIKAALVIRLIAGDTDAKYTPTEVSTLVSEVIDEQVARVVGRP